MPFTEISVLSKTKKNPYIISFSKHKMSTGFLIMVLLQQVKQFVFYGVEGVHVVRGVGVGDRSKAGQRGQSPVLNGLGRPMLLSEITF